MNPGDPHLTLALSPPIRWERRGNPPSPRLRRTGSRRMAAVARKSGRMRQVQGFKARIFRGILTMNLKGQEGRAAIILTPHPQSFSPLRGEGRNRRTCRGTSGVQGDKARIFRGNSLPVEGRGRTRLGPVILDCSRRDGRIPIFGGESRNMPLLTELENHFSVFYKVGRTYGAGNVAVWGGHMPLWGRGKTSNIQHSTPNIEWGKRCQPRYPK